MRRFCVRLSFLICAALDLDITFRTQKRLAFEPGAEIRMWAAPDEMHRSAAMLAGWSVVRTNVAGLLFDRQGHPQKLSTGA